MRRMEDMFHASRHAMSFTVKSAPLATIASRRCICGIRIRQTISTRQIGAIAPNVVNTLDIQTKCHLKKCSSTVIHVGLASAEPAQFQTQNDFIFQIKSKQSHAYSLYVNAAIKVNFD